MTSATLSHIGKTVRAHKVRWIAIVVSFVVLYFVTLLSVMYIRFDQLPNYITFYNWPANIWTIFASTPSFADALDIASQEWLIEIGHMNYDFGHGLSEWSVTVWPTKLFWLTLAGALVATIIALLTSPNANSCPATMRHGAMAATGGGAFLVGLSTATLSWVVCCATPTWIVTLSLLGMTPVMAQALQPLGTPMIVAGYGLLVGATYLFAHRRSADGARSGRESAPLHPTSYSRG